MAIYFDTNYTMGSFITFLACENLVAEYLDLSASFPLVFKNVTKIFIGRDIASGNALKGRNLERQVITCL